jgi:hypothetical protein
MTPENVSLLASGAPNDEERLLDLDVENSSSSSNHSRSRRRSSSRFLRGIRRPSKVLAYFLLIDFIIIGLLVYLTEPLITLLARNEELFSPRFTFPDDAPALSPGQRKIPHILHQTTANATIPDKWVDSQASCKKAYKDFEYKVRTGMTVAVE